MINTDTSEAFQNNLYSYFERLFLSLHYGFIHRKNIIITMKKPIHNHTILFFFSSIIFLALFSTSCSDAESEQAILWKFQNFDKLTYNFTQKTKISPIGGIFSAFGISNTATGKLIVTPTKDGKADLTLEDMDMGEMGEVLLQNMKTDKSKVTDMSVKGLNPDGTIDGEISEEMKLFHTGILPIPTKDLKVGESVKIEAQMPVPTSNGKIIMTGFQTLKLKSINKNLYTLENDILIDKYEDMTLENKIAEDEKPEIKGKGEYIFDIEKGYFTEGEIVLNIKMRADDLQKQGSQTSQGNGAINMNFGNMKVNFTSTVKINLEKTE
ncbi:hypothetical protein [Bernardetia sp.]|uniref:hypothetical protein n=1 Tax=Bernardetia sp. TaxID=1937974 RepID=UPI0025C5784F|nr:hypothetical protein [Bernardetia sp.]